MATDYSTWPGHAALQAFPALTQILAGTSGVVSDDDCDDAIASAIKAWDRDTGWFPFLAAGGDPTARTFDPPGPERGPVGIYVGMGNVGGGRMLFLGAGLLTCTSLAVGVTPTTPAGTALTVGRDFWIRPQNAPNYERPYTFIEFGAPQYGQPQSIVITGSWGFAATVPPDVYRSILERATVDLADAGIINRFGGQTSWSEADAKESFDKDPFGSTIDRLTARYEATVERYKKRSIS